MMMLWVELLRVMVVMGMRVGEDTDGDDDGGDDANCDNDTDG